MLRKAIEIYDSIFQSDERMTKQGAAIKAINEARIEAIKECIERACVDYRITDDGYGKFKVDEDSIKIDKQSILSLIDEVK